MMKRPPFSISCTEEGNEISTIKPCRSRQLRKSYRFSLQKSWAPQRKTLPSLTSRQVPLKQGKGPLAKRLPEMPTLWSPQQSGTMLLIVLRVFIAHDISLAESTSVWANLAHWCPRIGRRLSSIYLKKSSPQLFLRLQAQISRLLTIKTEQLRTKKRWSTSMRSSMITKARGNGPSSTSTPSKSMTIQTTVMRTCLEKRITSLTKWGSITWDTQSTFVSYRKALGSNFTKLSVKTLDSAAKLTSSKKGL